MKKYLTIFATSKEAFDIALNEVSQKADFNIESNLAVNARCEYIIIVSFTEAE